MLAMASRRMAALALLLLCGCFVLATSLSNTVCISPFLFCILVVRGEGLRLLAVVEEERGMCLLSA